MPVTTRLDAAVRLPGFAYRFLRGLARTLARLYWRLEVTGPGHVPAQGPVIIAPVHRSNIDFLIASAVTRRKVFFMTKDTLWRSPRFGRFLESVGAFPVHREGADRLAIDRAQAVLDNGDALILFPEGQRREGAFVTELHEGAAFLAMRTGATVVPVGIGGSAEAMPKGSKLVHPVKVCMVVGEPLTPPARSARGRVPRSQVHDFTEQLRTVLQSLYDDAERRAGRR
ncbi:MAG: lysophospholipid acyltransferase family protein [Acidimicrobiales bacterium]